MICRYGLRNIVYMFLFIINYMHIQSYTAYRLPDLS